MAFLKRRVPLRSLFAAAALFAMTAVHAQNANVVSANSSNDFLLSLNFFGAGGPTATPLNQDHLSYASIQSLAFMVNQKSFTLDLVVADNISGNIAVYPGDFTLGPPVATVVWGPSQGPSPASPNGLTVDAAGNLFVVNSGKSPQLWVFPAAGTPGCTTPPLPLYPALCEPVQIPDTYAKGQQLVETVIAPAGAGNTGHLLVLANNPATVLDYPFPGGHFTNSGRSTLITTDMFPAHTTTGGLAFWPKDNSLLITNQAANSILRYSCCISPGPMPDFADNLGGNGTLTFKIKTSYQATGMPGQRTVAPYAFVAQSGSVSQVLEFNGPGAPQHMIDIHQNLNHPEGLATTTAGAAAADTCIGAGCNPTTLLIHRESGFHSPPLVEDVCVVPNDNRPGGCPGNISYINDVCPNFDTSGNHMYLPGFLCGTPGFTVIKTLTQHTGFDGTLTDNITQLDSGPACFPAHVNFPFVLGNSPLTTATLAWGPGSGEGNFLARGRIDEIGEVTDGCGYVHGGTSDKSVWIEGLNLDLDSAGLVALVDSKYQDLETTVQTLQGGTLNGVNIATSVANQLSDNNPMGCAQLSQTYFDFAWKYEGPPNPAQQQQDLQIAADLLSNADTSGSPTSSITCDSIVTTNLLPTSPCYPTCFTETLVGPPPVFNPSGQVRVRLANLYFNINSRILGNCPNTVNACPPNLNDTPEPPAWPPMGPEAVSPPPSGFTECLTEPAGLYPPPGGCPQLIVSPNPATHLVTPVTVTWSLFGSTLLPSTSCTLDSGGGDGTFTPAVMVFPSAYSYSAFPSNTASQGGIIIPAAGTVTYTLTCSGPEPSKVQFVLTVL